MPTAGPVIVTLPLANWRDQAACRDLDPDLFAPIEGEGEDAQHLQDAARFCVQSGCAAREACLDFALDTEQPTGVWGGKLAPERRAILAARRRSA
jgi:WhiB family redox-sensing transcriptional regulator